MTSWHEISHGSDRALESRMVDIIYFYMFYIIFLCRALDSKNAIFGLSYNNNNYNGS